MAFTQKEIVVTFVLSALRDVAGNVTGQPTFNGVDNTVTLEGYRVSATIIKAGGLYSQGSLELRIYGMSLDLMNQLSTLGKTPIYVEGNQRNLITVSAGDENGIGLVFQGSISQAYTDLASAPEGVFVVSAFSLLYEAVLTIPATSFRGTIEAATVIQGLATQMGKNFENNGVTTVLRNPYFRGSALMQLQDCIREAGIEWNNGDNGTIAIWPKGGSRGGFIPLISPNTGLIGFPYPSGQGFMGLNVVFSPNINFGCRIEVQNTITPANGIWTVQNLIHDIESQVPHGNWASALTVTPPGYTAIVR